MRTTLTLDDDVAARLTAEARRSGRSFRAIVNEMLRRGLTTRITPPARKPPTVAARDLGKRLPGLSLDSFGDLLEQAEGPLHR